MMRALRDRKFMKIVLWMIIIVFIGGIFFMWGVQEAGLTEDNRNLLAKGDGVRVTYQEFDQAYQGVMQTYYNSMEDTPTEEESKRLRAKVLDQMIEEAILRRTAKELGVTVGDEEIMENLERSPYFQGKDGRFSKAAYLQMLEANRLSPQAFEADQRRQLLLQKIRLLLGDSVLYPDSELDAYATLLGRDLKASYVLLDGSDYERKVKVTEADLKDYYEAKRTRYDRPERAKVRHVLLGLPNNATQQDKDRTRATLEEYRSQLIAGKITFAELVKKHSQDEGTKDKGGDLGWISRDGMRGEMREFENVAFALKSGGVSKPVLSSYGYHLIQLEDHEKALKTTFEGVREKVMKDYRSEKGARMLFAVVSKLTEGLEVSRDLSKAAAEQGLPVSTTSWFDRTSGIPGLKDSRSASEDLAGLQIGDWTGPKTIGGRRAFFQITEARAGSDKDLLKEGQVAATARKLLENRQEIWFEAFIKDQRKRLGVKVLSEG